MSEETRPTTEILSTLEEHFPGAAQPAEYEGLVVSAEQLVDVAMFLTLASSLVSGIVLWLVLPSGRRSGYESFLNIAKIVWVDFHTYVSLVFAVALLVHLALNLRLFSSMLKCMLRRDARKS